MLGLNTTLALMPIPISHPNYSIVKQEMLETRYSPVCVTHTRATETTVVSLVLGRHITEGSYCYLNGYIVTSSPSLYCYRDHTEEVITYAHFSFLYGSEVRTHCYSLLLSCVFFCQGTPDQLNAEETRMTVTQWYSTIPVVFTWPEQHASSTLH